MSLFLDNGLIRKHLAEFVLQFWGRTADSRVSLAARSFPPRSLQDTEWCTSSLGKTG